MKELEFDNHKKLHTSQTEANARFSGIKFDNHENYTPLKLLSMRYPCVVVLQPYKTTQLSNPNIICKKEGPKEKVKEKKSQIIDSFYTNMKKLIIILICDISILLYLLHKSYNLEIRNFSHNKLDAFLHMVNNYHHEKQLEYYLPRYHLNCKYKLLFAFFQLMDRIMKTSYITFLFI